MPDRAEAFDVTETTMVWLDFQRTVCPRELKSVKACMPVGDRSRLHNLQQDHRMDLNMVIFNGCLLILSILSRSSNIWKRHQ